MAALPLRPFNVNNICCNKDKKYFVADITDLGSRFVLLYDDAIDEGLALWNPRTGVQTVWYVADSTHDHEGDLTGWTLKPTAETLRKTPNLEGWTFTVFND